MNAKRTDYAIKHSLLYEISFFYEKLDYWIMQFESFNWLSHHGL